MVRICIAQSLTLSLQWQWTACNAYGLRSGSSGATPSWQSYLCRVLPVWGCQSEPHISQLQLLFCPAARSCALLVLEQLVCCMAAAPPVEIATVRGQVLCAPGFL